MPNVAHAFFAVVVAFGSIAAPLAARASQVLQPGAPGEPTKTIDAAAATDLTGVHFTAADVAFVQRMIGHHAQAIEMVALLPSRTSREEMKRLAQRIEISQRDEIQMMQDWLRTRGQPFADAHAHHQHTAPTMPGMLTSDEMARLTAATGADFDRLFLDGMIKHHAGALAMAQELLATPGAGQEPELFAFVSDVDADQRMEIDRMYALRKELK